MKKNINGGQSTKIKREVVRAIRLLHAQGEPLNIHAVKRYHPRILAKAYSVSPFWGWTRAVNDTGIDYRKINVDLLEKIACKFCGKEFRSLSSHLPRIHEVSAAEYLQDGYDESILNETTRSKLSRSLRFDKDLIPHWEPIWSPEYVSDRIHELHRRGFPLHSSYIFLKEKGLMTAAKRYFGSWDAALQKAGLNPADIRLASHRISYQKEDIIRSLLERQEVGRPLNFASVYKNDLRLINASRLLFGSYSKALRAAGIDPDKVRHTRRPYRAAECRRFLNAVRRVAAIPVSRRRPAIAALRKNYHQIALSLYGLAWKKIAREAGVPYHVIHPKAPGDYSSRKKVITALRQRLKAGMEVSRDRVKGNKELFNAVLRYFPRYYDCYPAIGLKKYIAPVRRHYATREDVIAAIQKRDAMNLGIHLSDLIKRPTKKGDISLYSRAIQIFGAWSRALNAAGIPAEKQRPGKPPRYPTQESVLDEIRRRKRKGLSLVARVVRRGLAKDKDTMLYELGMRYFQSWPVAVKKALQIRK